MGLFLSMMDFNGFIKFPSETKSAEWKAAITNELETQTL